MICILPSTSTLPEIYYKSQRKKESKELKESKRQAEELRYMHLNDNNSCPQTIAISYKVWYQFWQICSQWMQIFLENAVSLINIPILDCNFSSGTFQSGYIDLWEYLPESDFEESPYDDACFVIPIWQMRKRIRHYYEKWSSNNSSTVNILHCTQLNVWLHPQ